jgi:hypothetical protein
MRTQDAGFDYRRYQQLLADAVDEGKRLALIALLIDERARDRLAAQRASDRAAMTASTIARVVGTAASGASGADFSPSRSLARPPAPPSALR